MFDIERRPRLFLAMLIYVGLNYIKLLVSWTLFFHCSGTLLIYPRRKLSFQTHSILPFKMLGLPIHLKCCTRENQIRNTQVLAVPLYTYINLSKSPG